MAAQVPFHCRDHPKYNGTYEVKRTCGGCEAVRLEYTTQVKAAEERRLDKKRLKEQRLEEKRKARAAGTGHLPSLTTPGFKCGVGHLAGEIAVLMSYGHQPPYFWKQKVSTSPGVKDLFKSTMILARRFYDNRTEDTRSMYAYLWQVCMPGMNSVHKKSVDVEFRIKEQREESKPEEKAEATPLFAGKTYNPFLDDEDPYGEEEGRGAVDGNDPESDRGHRGDHDN